MGIVSSSRAGVALVVVGFLVACGAGAGGSPSPSLADSTASPTPQPTASPTASPETPTPTPTPIASPTSNALPPPESWESGFTIRNEGEMVIARGVVRGANGYLAATEGFVSQEGGPRLASRGFWRSDDGRAWDAVEAPIGIGDWLHTITTTRDGDFLVLARTYDESGIVNETVVRRSSDGITWTDVDSGLPDDLHVYSVDHGPSASLLVAGEFGEGSNDLAAWLSADGVRWEKVLDLDDRPGWVTVQDGGAGAEGFVIAGTAAADDNSSHEYFAFASADGRTWVEAEDEPFGETDPQFRPDPYVAPLGPDWVAFLHRRDGSIRTFRSADGLDWTEVGLIERDEELFVFAPVIPEVDGRLYFSTVGTGVAPGSGQAGIWTSTDGATWEPMEMGADAYLGGMTAHDGTAVAITTRVAGNSSAAEIWIGPTD